MYIFLLLCCLACASECPVNVFPCGFHSDGTGRTGTYILIDMVLNRMAKGDAAAAADVVKKKKICSASSSSVFHLFDVLFYRSERDRHRRHPGARS